MRNIISYRVNYVILREHMINDKLDATPVAIADMQRQHNNPDDYKEMSNGS
jgi:hypothetical protein